jgi:uncharacterized protein (DUF3084 family)
MATHDAPREATPGTPASAPPTPESPPAGAGTAPPKHRNRWIWVSALLAAVCVALLIWGLSTRSDLDDANQQVSTLQGQIAQGKQTGSDKAADYQKAYQDLEQQLGASNQDLAAAQQDAKAAQAEADQAQQDADAASEKAANAKSKTDKANAQTDKANADAKAAQAQAQEMQDCAKAFASAVATVSAGDDPQAAVEQIKPDLQAIAPGCKAAFSG